jgi:hypothetical protein
MSSNKVLIRFLLIMLCSSDYFFFFPRVIGELVATKVLDVLMLHYVVQIFYNRNKSLLILAYY